jgi:hypothetical protein
MYTGHATRRQSIRPRSHASGYTEFPASQRPHCDMCGPFRGAFLRPVGRDEFGQIWRCEGCDREAT